MSTFETWVFLVVLLFVTAILVCALVKVIIAIYRNLKGWIR